ncbi:MAG: FapA family protein [Desulfarculales bacterium]|nr:FapA family protein [Desulfarculales bacterium]
MPENAAAGSNSQTIEELSLVISPDGLTASLYGKTPEGSDHTAVGNLLARLIRQSRLSYGLLVQEILKASEVLGQGRQVDGWMIARGMEPGAGEDARIEIVLPSYKQEQEKAQAADFRDRGGLPLVKAGEVIAVLHPEKEGSPGKSVRGEPVAPPMPRILRLVAGHGVELQKNDAMAVALVNGMLARLGDDKFEIIDLLEIQGDVDFEVGNVEFNGLVRVHGAVLSGFKVKAHSLEAQALESNSQIEVVDYLNINQGIMGSHIQAGGDVSAFFIRQSEIQSDGNISVKAEIVQSKLRAKGLVTVTGAAGRIVNSNIVGVRGIVTPHLVNSGQDACQVRVGMDREIEDKLLELKRCLNDAKKQRDALCRLMEEQDPELKAMEDELKALVDQIAVINDDHTKENLLAQVNMIKPLRRDLRETLNANKDRLEQLKYDINRHYYKIREIDSMFAGGPARLSVKESADTDTKIFTPRASLTLDQDQKNFSAYEVELHDKTSGASQYKVHLGSWQMPGAVSAK